MTKSSGILVSEPGLIKAYFIPARYGHWRKEPTSWTEHLLAESPYILLDIMEDVYGYLFQEKKHRIRTGMTGWGMAKTDDGISPIG